MRRICAVLIISLVVTGAVTPGYAYFDGDFYGEYLLANSKNKISMDLEGASLVNVLKVLSQQTGLSFVSAESVTDRRLTLYLEKVPLKEAMDTIFKANNLIYEFYPESNIFIIKETVVPAVQLETRVYKLKHAVVPGARLLKRIEQSGEAGQMTTGTSEKDEGGILSAVRDVLSEYGTANEDPRTNSLVVRDLVTSFPFVERVINDLDVAVPKVLIEVEVLDVSKEVSDRLGVEFPTGLGGTLSVLTGTDEANTIRTTTFPFKVFGNEAAYGTSSVTPGKILASGFTATLDMLRADVDTKFLARPKILTLSGETAEINLVTNEAITAEATVSAEGGETIRSWEIEREDIGTMLKVTPQVNMVTHEIVMIVEPVVSSAVNDPVFTDANNRVNKVQRRESKSVVRIKDHETLMIGGLLTKETTERKTRVPIFGDLPLVGKLFRHSALTEEDRELLVFLTPKIVRDDGTIISAPGTYSVVSREQTPGDRKRIIDQAMARFE